MKLPSLLVACLLLSSPALAAIGDNSVGMNIHVGRQSFVDACADLGVEWVRLDGNWYAHEPTRDSYSWGYLDDGVDAAVAAGLQVYLTLAYTPAWEARHGDTDGETYNDVPDSSAEWVEFVTDAVTRYRARGVTHFGIWNEANLDHFWEGTIAEYVNLILVPGAAAVRAACVDCRVLGPDFANVDSDKGSPDDLLEETLTLAPTGTFDILAHHIYQGFPETGVEIWDGDRYFNVLDQQRFFLSRRDLRQVLDAVGYQGEVWITETGYRAHPPGDTGEEALQELYVTLALGEQLQRAWYTNTFFYEISDCGIDQPTCDIDGYGLLRPTAGSPGTRSFSTDYRLKPAFLALRQFIADHPELRGQGSVLACGDGDDNDGDGRTDLADRGCSGPGDDDESDDPPRRRLTAQQVAALTVDGDLGDWSADGWVALGVDSWVADEALGGAGDLALRVAARWNAAGLYLAVEAVDDVHENDHTPADLWLGDSLQLAFDVGQSGGTGYDVVDDHEINFGLAGGVTSSFRFHGPAAASDAWQVAVARVGTATSYEILLPPDVLPSARFEVGRLLGFSFLINDADGLGRVGWIEWTPGVGVGKVPELFGEILLHGGGLDGGVVADATAPDSSGADTTGADTTGADTTGADAARADQGASDTSASDTSQPGADANSPRDAGLGGGDAGSDAAVDGCGCAAGAGGACLPLLLLSIFTCAARRWRRATPRA